MLPKIQFHRSFVYDEHLKRPETFKMPSNEFIYSNTYKLEKVWRMHEKNILKELARVTGLKWREAHIYAYITAGVGWFSVPLTLSITKDIPALFDTLVHELIHRIFSENENWPIIKKNWLKLMKKYKAEETDTRIHIPVHAIHKHIFLKFFSERAYKKEIQRMKNYKAYARSLEIVERDGYKEIIRSLTAK